jgi:hypothetical protein
MRSTSSEQLKPWLTGVMLLLLVHSLGTARTAWAGCGHRVVSNSDLPLSFNHLDAIVIGDSPSPIAGQPAQGPGEPAGQNRRAPCTGPGCSSRVPLPVSTASPGSDRSDQWVSLRAAVSLGAALPCGRTIDEPTDRPTGGGAPIFRPPPA